MRIYSNVCFWVCCLALGTGLTACRHNPVKDAFTPTDVGILTYHYNEHFKSLEMFTSRLYAKNPKFEPDKAARARKIKQIFHHGPFTEYDFVYKPSHKVLEAAFAESTEGDRVYLLSLGLAKGVREAYEGLNQTVFISGLQVPLEKLQKLHHNISQVNWRLKTNRDKSGALMFSTNEAGESGYINMGYEVIMTEILTRIKDDIHLRGGLPGKYLFNMSSMFVSIVI